MFEKDDETGKLKAVHHPFTHPMQDDIAVLDHDPTAARADAYDIVLNGVELGGGSIRIHDAGLQKKMFELLGISEEESNMKFGFLRRPYCAKLISWIFTPIFQQDAAHCVEATIKL